MSHILRLKIDDSGSSFVREPDYFSFFMKSAIDARIPRSELKIASGEMGNAHVSVTYDDRDRFRDIEIVVSKQFFIDLNAADELPGVDVPTDNNPIWFQVRFHDIHAIVKTVLFGDVVGGFLLADVKQASRRVWINPNVVLFDEVWNFVGILYWEQELSRSSLTFEGAS